MAELKRSVAETKVAVTEYIALRAKGEGQSPRALELLGLAEAATRRGLATLEELDDNDE